MGVDNTVACLLRAQYTNDTDMEVLPAPIKVLEMRAKLAVNLLRAGWSITDIAEIFNMNKSSISRIIKNKNKIYGTKKY